MPLLIGLSYRTLFKRKFKIRTSSVAIAMTWFNL